MLKKTTFYFLKICLTILIFGVLVWQVHPGELWLAFQQANLFLIGCSLLLMPVNLLLQTLKWQSLAGIVKPEISFRESLYTLLKSMTVGFVTPGRIGEYSRAVFVKDADWKTTLGVVILDKFYNLALIFGIGLFSLVLFTQHRFLPRWAFVPGLIIAIMFVLFLILLMNFPIYFQYPLKHWQKNLPSTNFFHKLVSGIICLQTTVAQKVFWLALFSYVTFCSQLLLLLNAFQPVSAKIAVKTIPAVFFVKALLPISIGDLGVREGAAIFLLKHYQIANSHAFNASFLLFFINLIIPSLMGWLLFLLEKYPLRGKQ